MQAWQDYSTFREQGAIEQGVGKERGAREVVLSLSPRQGDSLLIDYAS